jgi:hypothetical protein
MSPIYTQPSDPALLEPAVLAATLRVRVASGLASLQAIPAEVASRSADPMRWSTKQVVGHLIDSATNNLQRIVLLQLQPEIDLAGYEQNGWVRVQRYDLAPWAEVLSLWAALNGHLAHVIEHVDPAHLTRVWKYDGQRLTLGFIIEDYIAHLEHHLRALEV